MLLSQPATAIDYKVSLTACVTLNAISILSNRETSKMLLSWKTKTPIFLTGCSTTLVVFFRRVLVQL